MIPVTKCIHRALYIPCSTSEEETNALLSKRIHELKPFAERGVESARTELIYLVMSDRLKKEGHAPPCKNPSTPSASAPQETAPVPSPETSAPEATSPPKRIPPPPKAPRPKKQKAIKETAPYTGPPLVEEPTEDAPTLSDFPPVTLTEAGVPKETFAAPMRHSFYHALNKSDPAKYPLSTTEYRIREDIKAQSESIYGDEALYIDKYRTFSVKKDAHGIFRLHAIILKNVYEPRWGMYFCPSLSSKGPPTRAELEWQQDMLDHPTPVFFEFEGVHRYCGHWSFERVDTSSETRFQWVVDKKKMSNERTSVFRVTLASYDDRWGAPME